ncbi:hypothetical protein ABI59_08590 [Acidobacteria bacterium Mor1]|nr:hypothetical protein ABI59_08590 [Acidobacteria bacterium Mor1]
MLEAQVLRDAINRLETAVLARARLVLAASIVLTLVALVLGSGVKMKTSRVDLAPPDDPDQIRLEALTREFRGSGALIAAVEAPESVSDQDLRGFVDRLAADFAAGPQVQHVFHKVDTEWLLQHGLHLYPPEQLDRIAGSAAQRGALLELLPGIDGFAALNRAIGTRLEAGAPQGAAGEEALAGVSQLSRLIAFQRRFLEDPDGVLAELESRPPLAVLAGSDAEQADGYLRGGRNGGGRIHFIVISPAGTDRRLPALRKLVDGMRRLADARLAETPPGAGSYTVSFTGQPATTVEEMATVQKDAITTSILAVIGVSILTFFVFRYRAHAILALAALFMGIIWAFGAVRLHLGYLNLITSSFVSTLVGVGVDYVIHPVSEYELEEAHNRDPVEATRRAYHHVGPAVFVGGLTTAFAFFSILLMEFRGFAELGLVAGVGVVLCLFAALCTLPAILVLYGKRRARRDTRPARRAAAVDRVWAHWLAGITCRYPRTVVFGALALTAAALLAIPGIRFDTDLLELLPAEAESVRYQKRLVRESTLSPLFNVAAVDDLDALRQLEGRAAAEPHVARFESVLRYLPRDADASSRSVARLGAMLAQVRLAPDTRAVDPADLVDSAETLIDSLDAAAADAFDAGVSELVEPLEAALEDAELVAEIAAAAGPAEVEAWSAGQVRLLDWARRLVADLRAAAASAPPTVETLPEPLRSRFVTGSGRYLAFLYPEGNVFDPDRLAPYVEASRRVSENATGFPLMFLKMSRRITDGFYKAVAAGLGLVLIVLLITFRSLRDALLAALPLAVGATWMLGGMGLLDVHFNFANLVAVPLIIGVGIDHGVHIVSRLRYEGNEGMETVLRHTGRAILIASLTTMIGFGSLTLADHSGMQSLGIVLLLGVGACLLTSMVVLPNVLILLGLARR